MITWMLMVAAASVALAGAALAADELCRLMERPRRWGWMVAMLATLALPLVFRLVPAPVREQPVGTGIDAAQLAALIARSERADAVAPSRLATLLASDAADPVLIGVWITAAAAMLATLLITYLRLRRGRAGARRVTLAGIPALLTRRTGPMVIGIARPEVVVPGWIEELPEEERALIVRHEWEHIRGGDTRLLLLSALIVAVTPWNLPLWWMRRRLRQAVEVDCDARVLAAGANRRVYGRMLIETAGRPGRAPFLAPALVELPSMLERRIVAMTTPSPAYRRGRIALATAAAGLLILAACEMTPRGGSPSPTEPTLADVVEPGSPKESQRIVLQFDDSTAASSARVVGTVSPTGNVAMIYHIDEAGDTLRADRLRLRSGPLDQLNADGTRPLYIVDGQRVESIEGVDPERIREVDVLKGPVAVERFGEDGRDGVVQIRTGDPGEGGVRRVRRVESVSAVEGGEHSSEITDEVVEVEVANGAPQKVQRGLSFLNAEDPDANPLFFVDGEKVASIEGLDPARIEKIEVLKGEAAREYGPEAEDGVILITLRK